MLQVFKILHNIDTVENSAELLSLVKTDRTRGHSLKLVKIKKYCRTECRRNSFFFRVVDTWNSLSEEVVSSKSVNEFKSALNKYWFNDPIKFNIPT